MTAIELTKEAERDLIDIFLFGVEHFGVAQAERYSAALMAKIESAAANPSFGADYEFVRSGLRRYEATSHAIYYRPTEEGILVLRILHGRMDPACHLI
ncbi:type II toxin-antitoxin system RelE/ParE family toxin [Salipiger abyssi]|uniref:Toxin n=1 Tax=Salipiger abyssi TaxID=1250539 RepID=A0A1P8V125_9RHOB|nr:type II toxin-antitoxin system RelE/ParE family toxin [Salipiger abyssi]APZ55353.1 toxin ParE1/3/4 [Salipiger abyssi]